MKSPFLKKSDIFRGALIYAGGDLIASLILNQFSPARTLGMIAAGGTVYALEIPRYFRWIDRRTVGLSAAGRTLGRTGLALLYFNPLWIARHLLFIRFFSGRPIIPAELLRLGLQSFLWNIPIAFAANYLIQNRISLKHRFTASALFSALMAIYYAVSEVIFK